MALQGRGLLTQLILCSVALTAGGFVAQTRGFKDGRTLPIVTFSNLVAMLVAILFGLLAFNEVCVCVCVLLWIRPGPFPHATWIHPSNMPIFPRLDSGFQSFFFSLCQSPGQACLPGLLPSRW